MSCGAFGSGGGNCSGGGAAPTGGGPGGNCGMPRRCADRGFFDPFCMPLEKPRFEPSCYFNPFVHAQCLGVDMNMEGFRKDILKCQEDYKKAVWAVLKKYAVGEGDKKGGGGGSGGGGGGGGGEGENANNFAFMTNGNNNMFRDLSRMNFFNNINASNNARRSSSIPMDPSLFQLDDPRNQKNRRQMPNGRPM